MPPQYVISISGKKRSGKSTLAKDLSSSFFYRHDFSGEVINFGDCVKDDLNRLYGVPYEYLYGTEDQKQTILPYRWKDLEWYEGSRTDDVTVRGLMQEYAESKRQINAFYWAFEGVNRIKESAYEVVIVGDLRHKTEFTTLKATFPHNLYTIRLLRDPSNGEDRHISEIDLDPDTFDQSQFDLVIDNRSLYPFEVSIRAYNYLEHWVGSLYGSADHSSIA